VLRIRRDLRSDGGDLGRLKPRHPGALAVAGYITAAFWMHSSLILESAVDPRARAVGYFAGIRRRTRLAFIAAQFAARFATLFFRCWCEPDGSRPKVLLPMRERDRVKNSSACVDTQARYADGCGFSTSRERMPSDFGRDRACRAGATRSGAAMREIGSTLAPQTAEAYRRAGARRGGVVTMVVENKRYVARTAPGRLGAVSRSQRRRRRWRAIAISPRTGESDS